MRKNFRKLVTGTAMATMALAGVASTMAATPAVASASTQIAETGSTLLYPLFNNEWIPAYKSVDSSVQITASGTGSGTGISQAMTDTVQIGASDAYMAPALLAQKPSMLNIPLAISAQQVMYNLPGLKSTQHLNLSGTVLANIYMGKVGFWDDASIKKLNPTVKLPHKAIIPVRRSDGSGDTFLFTSYLSDANSTWKSSVAYGTTISWPAVSREVGAKGNSGIISALHSNPYSISYVGISYLNTALKQGLGYAAIQNEAGKFVLPTKTNIAAAASVMTKKTPKNEIVSLIYAPGATSYPIINYEYAVVDAQQDSATASALKKFLTWAVSPTGGNSAKYLNTVNFLPLPSTVEKLSVSQINTIGQ